MLGINRPKRASIIPNVNLESFGITSADQLDEAKMQKIA